MELLSQRTEIDHTIAGDDQLRRGHLRADESSRRRLIENQDTVNELTTKIQELQKEVNCMNDSRDFLKTLNQSSHVPSQPASLPPHPDPGGMLSRPGDLLSRNDGPPDIWDTHGISGNVFVNPLASSSSPFPGGSNTWIPNVPEDSLPQVTSERQNPDTALDPRFQSGPWPGGMESPRQAVNKWWRTREGPEPACVQTPRHAGGTCRETRAN